VTIEVHSEVNRYKSPLLSDDALEEEVVVPETEESVTVIVPKTQETVVDLLAHEVVNPRPN
jgi:hypothetical protein